MPLVRIVWSLQSAWIQAPTDDPGDMEDFYANMPPSGGSNLNGVLLVLAALGFVGWLIYKLSMENDRLRAEVQAGREAQAPTSADSTPSEKERIDEYFRFKGRSGGDASPGRSQ